MPQPCNSRRLVLTLERATESVSEISSAARGLGERNRSACTWATVRLMPHLVPISPQWRMNFWATGVSVEFVVSVISVVTEDTELTGACQGVFETPVWTLGKREYSRKSGSFASALDKELEHADFGDGRGQFRDVDADGGSLPFAAFDVQLKIFAIKDAEPLADVAEADAFDVDVGHFFFGDAYAVVGNLDLQPAVPAGGAEEDAPAFKLGGQAMLQAVFDHRLQQHAGDEGFECYFVDFLN